MNGDLTHASFFSGVGGLDLGLERAGWRTVSFSEIDPYASAVLGQRWPGVPNLGDIVRLAAGRGTDELDAPDAGDRDALSNTPTSRADLWTGGFPCQDLSVAGKRRGMGAGTRSGLAYAFLDLVGRHRPRFVLLENVPGLLSSHGGRDMAALIGALVELGYGVGYRVLDARYFGVPQRRRRVFILGITPGGRAGAECAAEVLSVGSRCDRHPPAGVEAGPRATDGARIGIDIAGGLTRRYGKGVNTTADDGAVVVGTLNDLGHHGWTANAQSVDAGHVVVGAPPDPGRVRAPDGLAGRLDDRGGVEVITSLSQGLGSGGPDAAHAQAGWLLPVAPLAFTKSHNATSTTDAELWEAGQEARSMNGFDGDRTTLILSEVAESLLLPVGLDSHRYRCCGNGVVSDVSEWIGRRLAELA